MLRSPISVTDDPQATLGKVDNTGDTKEHHGIPSYTIDLSLPPVKRYQQLAEDFLPQVASLSSLFDEIVPRPAFRSLAKLLLRRLYSHEQTEELRGIHIVTGVGMHLLVAFNVLLDLFMGCTSGGIRVSEGQRMLHCRTLDWGMHTLRKVIVHLDYIRHGVRIASAVTYVGYVGVLTGVRQGLSMSLNFRPIHNASTRLANARFYLHHALVLFGLRPSISSILREVLLNQRIGTDSSLLEHCIKNLPSTPSTAAYLIFCDGERTVVLEKDYDSALLRSSTDFIVVTNHDAAQEIGPSEHCSNHTRSAQAGDLTGVLDKIAMHGVAAESSSRKRCMTQLWKEFMNRSGSSAETTDTNTYPIQATVPTWLTTYPITNAMTHYAVVMDPVRGEFTWIKHHPNPRALWDQLIQQDHIK